MMEADKQIRILESEDLSKKFRQVSLSDLKVSGKNDLIYRPVKAEDPEIWGLARSIKKYGLRVPLVISRDGFIISGHRRRLACELAGITSVLCKVEPITVDDPEFDRLLREENRQRIKGVDELIREAVVDATADQKEIGRKLMMERLEKSQVTVAPMAITGTKVRAEVKGNRPLLDAAIKVIDELEDFWPLSDRQIHYRLLNDPPLKHRSKPDSIYKNDRESYQTLTDILTRGRLSGEIPWESISDETRPQVEWDVHKNISPFAKNQFDQFMKGYFRDYMQSQPNHIEIVGEKMTIQSIISPVARKYCIPYTIGRGYSSIQPRYDMAERFRESGKSKLITLLLSDFDPDGEEIAQSFARSMRDDFDIEVHPIKVALTRRQVVELQLPPKLEAKRGSSTYQKFVDENGKHVFELEAISPEKLQEILDNVIKSIIAVNAFNSEMEQEGKEFMELGKYRRRVLDVINNTQQ